MKAGDSELGEDNLREIEEIVSVCAGLVIVDEKSNVARLVHYTTQEYFARTQTRWFPNAQTVVGTALITYLSFHAFETGFCLTDKEFKARLRLNLLYDYAARNWGHYACAALAQAKGLILCLFESEAKVSAAAQAMMAEDDSYRWQNNSQRVSRQMTGLHLVVYFGLKEVMSSLLTNEHSLDIKDSYGFHWRQRTGTRQWSRCCLPKTAWAQTQKI